MQETPSHLQPWFFLSCDFLLYFSASGMEGSKPSLLDAHMSKFLNENQVMRSSIYNLLDRVFWGASLVNLQLFPWAHVFSHAWCGQTYAFHAHNLGMFGASKPMPLLHVFWGVGLATPMSHGFACWPLFVVKRSQREVHTKATRQPGMISKLITLNIFCNMPTHILCHHGLGERVINNERLT